MTDTTLLTKVVKAIAAAEGVPIDEVDPLYDYIDPEIVNKLDDMGGDSTWRFIFEFDDHQVTVTHDFEIFVDDEQYYTEKSV